jgi:hypothetical protein
MSLLPLLQLPAFAAVGDNFEFAFHNITSPAVSANVLDGEDNLSLLVTDLDTNKVSFLFTNNPNFSSITDVYFDNGPLASFSSLTFSNGVRFSQNDNPANLPGGNSTTPAFNGRAFRADSNAQFQPMAYTIMT